MSQSTTAYDRLGGEDTIRRLVHRFYQLMDAVPEAAACRAIHPPSLANSELKLFEYLSYWLGGPPLYTEKYGHPMLRARHLPARIGTEEAIGWLLCFHQAWADTVDDPELTATLMPKIDALAGHMRNVA